MTFVSSSCRSLSMGRNSRGELLLTPALLTRPMMGVPVERTWATAASIDSWSVVSILRGRRLGMFNAVMASASLSLRMPA